MSRRLSTLAPVRPAAGGGIGAGAPGGASSRPGGPSRHALASRKSFGTAYTHVSSRGGGGGEDDGSAPAALSAGNAGALYSTVIKLSAENKINVKNTWALQPFIDGMDRLIDEDGGRPAAAPTTAPQKSRFGGAATGAVEPPDSMLNFQRASVALDASVKIYSCRVDDVYSTSYRVLESLSRSDYSAGLVDAAADGDDDDGSDAENGGAGSGGTKSRVRAVSGRGGPSRTIEHNPAAITLSRVDAATAIDPVFHRLTTSFDELGVAGMLLNRLTVQPGGHLSLDSTTSSEAEAKATAASVAAAPPAGAAHGTVRLPLAAVAPLLAAPPAPITSEPASLSTLYSSLATFSALLGIPQVSATSASRLTRPNALQLPRMCVAATVATAPMPATAAVAEAAPASPSPAGAAKVTALVPDAFTASDAETVSRAEAAASAIAGSPNRGGGGGGSGIDDDDGIGAPLLGGLSSPSPVRPRTAGSPAAVVSPSVGVQADAQSAATAAVVQEAWDAVLSDLGGDAGGGAAMDGSDAAIPAPARLVDADALIASLAPAGADGGYDALGMRAVRTLQGKATAHWRFGRTQAETAAAKKKAANKRSPAGTPAALDFTSPPAAFSAACAHAGTFAPAKRRAAPARGAARDPLLVDNEQLPGNTRARLTAAGHAQYLVPMQLLPAAVIAYGGSCDVALPARSSATASAWWLRLSHVRGGGTADSAGDAIPALDALTVAAPRGGSGAGAVDLDDGIGYGYGGGAQEVEDEMDAAGDATACDVTAIVAAAVAEAEAANGDSLSPSPPATDETGMMPGAGAPIKLMADVHRVNKVRVRYDTVAKRVDVRSLKDDMWARLGAADLPSVAHRAVEAASRKAVAVGEASLSNAFTDVSGVADGAGAPATAIAPVAVSGSGGGQVFVDAAASPPESFQRLITAMAPGLSSAVTVPFYFITLLHLANEHGLAVVGGPGAGTARPRNAEPDLLADLQIGMLAPAGTSGGVGAAAASSGRAAVRVGAALRA